MTKRLFLEPTTRAGFEGYGTLDVTITGRAALSRLKGALLKAGFRVVHEEAPLIYQQVVARAHAVAAAAAQSSDTPHGCAGVTRKSSTAL